MTRSAAPTNPFLFAVTLFFLIESLLGAVDARAETPASDTHKPFETITATVDVVGSAALGSFNDNWGPSVGGHVEFATPVYAGIARAGAHLFNHNAVNPAVPAFQTAWVCLGWTYEWRLPLRLAWGAGVEMGVAHMVFDDESTPRAREKETELGFGVTLQLAYAFTPCWSVVFTGEYREVLTKRPIEYVFYGVGLGRRFTTPRWLKEFLD